MGLSSACNLSDEIPPHYMLVDRNDNTSLSDKLQLVVMSTLRFRVIMDVDQVLLVVLLHVVLKCLSSCNPCFQRNSGCKDL